MSPTPLTTAMAGVAVTTALWCAVAAPARATYGARTTADEPQYLLTALSLYEDASLDIADELEDQRWRDFHEARLPEQTRSVDGHRFSPHDPLLPLVLAIPMGLGGWLATKLTLAAIAAALAAALVWVAVRRFAVPVGLAALVTLAFSLTAPLAAYGTQVYPELPAALVLTIGIGAVTGPLDRRGRVVLALAIVALPWLAVKYAPVAVALAAVGLVRLLQRPRTDARRSDGRRQAAVLAGALFLAGVGYLAFHRAVYGGWTVYAAGDHFVGGELTVAGVDPDYLGRSSRLVGLLVDRSFGLAAWAPAWLLGVTAVAALVRRRPAGWVALVVPLAAGWLTATFVALTMHGYWWPGRQVVVVLPAVVLAVAWWIAQVRVGVAALVVTAAVGWAMWAWLLVEVLAERLRLIIDFDATRNPLYRIWRLALPDYRSATAADWARHGAWLVIVVVLAAAGWRSVRPREPEESFHDDPDPATTDGPVVGVSVGRSRMR